MPTKAYYPTDSLDTGTFNYKKNIAGAWSTSYIYTDPQFDTWGYRDPAQGVLVNDEAAFIRFPDIDIPRGAKIVSASIGMTGKSGYVTNINNLSVYYAYVANAPRPSDISQTYYYLNFENYNWTYVDDYLTVPPFVIDIPVSIGIGSTGIQNVIRLPEWESGNAMVFCIANNSSSSNALRGIYGYGALAHTNLPVLTIIYTDYSSSLAFYDSTDTSEITGFLDVDFTGKTNTTKTVSLWANKGITDQPGILRNIKVTVSNSDGTFSGQTNPNGQECIDEKWVEIRSNGASGTGIVDDAQVNFKAIGGDWDDSDNYLEIGDMPTNTKRTIEYRVNLPTSISTNSQKTQPRLEISFQLESSSSSASSISSSSSSTSDSSSSSSSASSISSSSSTSWSYGSDITGDATNLTTDANIQNHIDASDMIDGNTDTYIQNFSYILIDFGTGVTKAVRKLRLYCYDQGAYQAFTFGKFQGSDDASTWTDLSSLASLPEPGSYPNWSEINIPIAVSGYRFYRITEVIFAKMSVASEWEMKEGA